MTKQSRQISAEIICSLLSPLQAMRKALLDMSNTLPGPAPRSQNTSCDHALPHEIAFRITCGGWGDNAVAPNFCRDHASTPITPASYEEGTTAHVKHTPASRIPIFVFSYVASAEAVPSLDRSFARSTQRLDARLTIWSFDPSSINLATRL